jgi:ABC-type uncharacterized transport system auxiliary subunit
MISLLKWFMIMVILAGLFSCGSVPDRRYFGLSYTMVDIPKNQEEKFPVTLRIQEPEILLAYDRPQIVYRFDPYKFKYYHFRFWVAKPQQMIAEVLHRHIKHVNLFRQVSLVYQREVPDFELVGQINAIEEYDAGDTWYAHISMSLQLVRFSDRKVIWAYEFDRKKEVFTKEPVYVVRAMSEIIEEEMRKIISGIEAAMGKEISGYLLLKPGA